jgi:hypothetical protein
MHSLDHCANTLKRPQLSPKSVFSGTLQKSSTNAGQLLGIKLGGTTSLRYRAQCINSTLIEKPLPCVYGLASNAHRQCHFGASFARKQQSASFNPLL